MSLEEQVQAAVERVTKPIIDKMEQMVNTIKQNEEHSTVIKDARLSKEFLDSLTPAQREMLENGINEQEELDSKAEFEKFIKERQAQLAKESADEENLKKEMM